MLTNESSSYKMSGVNIVFGGTVNGSDVLIVKATTVESVGVLPQIAKLVSDAQTA